MQKKIVIFTDGSSRGNPGRGGWGAIINMEEEIIELGGREDPTTNNRMEMTAIAEALAYVQSIQTDTRPVRIYTDSSYVLQGMTKWVYSWQQNGWKTKDKKEVLNKDLWQELMGAASQLELEWILLPGHVGIPANERCDAIATSFADGHPTNLYKGPQNEYSVSLAVTVDKNKADNKSRSRAKAYSYVSLVDGKIKTHDTWAECEDRVKGKKNVRYRKVLSEAEEKDLISEWTQTM